MRIIFTLQIKFIVKMFLLKNSISHFYFKILKNNIPCFTSKNTSSVTQYDIKKAYIIYKNFLNWLFKTFKTSEKEFRKKLFKDINFKKKT